MLEALKELRELPLLGEVVWWELSHVEITREELVGLFQKFGVPLEWLPPAIRGRKAFRMALHRLEAEDQLVRKIIDDEERIVFGLVKEIPDVKDLELQYENLNAVIFDKLTFTVSFKGEEIEEVKELFHKFKTTYTHPDIRSMLVNIVHALNGIPLREHGGIYFVPQANIGELDKLEKLLRSIGESKLYTLGVPDVEKTKKVILKIWRREIKDELEQKATEVEELFHKNRVRPSTLRRRLEEYKFLREKAKMFAELLLFDAKDIEEQISKLESKVKGLLLLEEML